jgi:23S rRNA pseudouridine1911/1915/1917 synthase
VRSETDLNYLGSGERLDRYVAQELDGVSRALVQRWISAGDVTVNGQRVRSSHRLVSGDIIRVAKSSDISASIQPVAMGLPIMYQDRDCVVIDKPAGLVVHPAISHHGDTLVHGLLAAYPDMASMVDAEDEAGLRPGIVHRLDKDTSGLIIVARHPASKEALQRQFRSRSVEKTYLALVHGRLAQPEGRISEPIGRDPRNRKRMAVVAGGREAITEYSTRNYLYTPHGHRELYALVQVRLLTGRTHQIRVHLSHIGHPVVGDRTYGWRRKRIACPRQFLHACRLGFCRPSDGARITLQSPLPQDLQSVLAQLEAVV